MKTALMKLLLLQEKDSKHTLLDSYVCHGGQRSKDRREKHQGKGEILDRGQGRPPVKETV